MCIAGIAGRSNNFIGCIGLRIIKGHRIFRMLLHKAFPFVHKIIFPFRTQQAIVGDTDHLRPGREKATRLPQ